MSRQVARDRAFKLIFEFVFSKEIDEDLLEEYISESDVLNEQEYIKTVVFGVAQKYDYLTEKIKSFSVGFSLQRIFKIDLAILLLASYEIEFMPDIPFKVSINEACELAKLYSTEKSVSFVNGVLSKFKKGEN